MQEQRQDCISQLQSNLNLLAESLWKYIDVIQHEAAESTTSSLDGGVDASFASKATQGAADLVETSKTIDALIDALPDVGTVAHRSSATTTTTTATATATIDEAIEEAERLNVESAEQLEEDTERASDWLEKLRLLSSDIQNSLLEERHN
jgi:methyl-accepting chemotaxis protein